MEVVAVVDRIALGKWGEDVAVGYLERAGYQVLARNWRCREGEIDIVALGDGALCFVEVKARSGVGYGFPAEAVTPVKARRIRRLATRWLTECRPPGRHDLRFDVVSIVRRQGAAPDVVHLQGAF